MFPPAPASAADCPTPWLDSLVPQCARIEILLDPIVTAICQCRESYAPTAPVLKPVAEKSSPWLATLPALLELGVLLLCELRPGLIWGGTLPLVFLPVLRGLT